MSASHGWSLVDQERKRELIDAIRTGGPTSGPVHAELDLTDRCNVACYFCNQMDVRTKESIPLEEVERLLGELAASGLKSVRMSGGGDPLMYKHFPAVQAALAEHGVVIDNLTTNGALLKPEIADRLVADGAREVIVSLNAVDAEDYQRMMRVRARTYDDVLSNLRHLLAARGDAPLPTVVVQFLLDPVNYRRLPEMYRLGRELGVDRIALNAVLEIPLQRLEGKALLGHNDHQLVRPYLEQVLREDQEAGLLQMCFPWPEWNDMTERLRASLAIPSQHAFPAAKSFDEARNGQCFFGWYTATIRGTGEMYPCCMLMNPEYKPLANAREGSVQEVWNGEGFTRLRQEHREVMLTRGRVFQRPGRFTALEPQCIESHRCALKNMYFRADEEFYHDLDEALDEMRGKEVRWFGAPRQIRRAAEVLAFRLYHGVQVRARALWRKLLRRRALRLAPEAFRRPWLHIGCGNKRLEGWVNIDMQPLPQVDVVADVTKGLRFRGAERIYAEHFLEHLHIDDVLSFLERSHDTLVDGGVIRLSTPNLDWVWLNQYTFEGPEHERANRAIVLNRAFRGWEHRFLWNKEILARALTACGFEDLSWHAYGDSNRVEFRQLERHETYPDSPDLPHVLIVEAVKGAKQPEVLERLRAQIRQEFLDHVVPSNGQPVNGAGSQKPAKTDALYLNDTLEHLPLDQAVDLLEHCHAALGKEGALRLSTPNLDWEWHTPYRLEGDADGRIQAALRLNRAFHGEGRGFLWNRELLAHVLQTCGFTDVSWFAVGDGQHEAFREHRVSEADQGNPQLWQMLFAEARRGELDRAGLRQLRQRVENDYLNHMKG